MNGADIINEIGNLLEEESIEPDVALRLILANQVTMTRQLSDIQQSVTKFRMRSEERMDSFEKDIDDRLDDVTDRLLALEEYRTHYPSLMWLWIHRRRTLFFVAIVLALAYTVVFGWLGIDDVRHAVFNWVGIPLP